MSSSPAPTGAANAAPETPEVSITFNDMPLSDAVKRALKEMDYERPTPVQHAAFELAAEGRDLIVQARTGTGKTAAFGIPIVDRMVTVGGGVQALILAPTRELALQTTREMAKIGAHSGLKTCAVYGGASMERQIQELNDGATVVSGTPGRVLDHLKRGTLDASNLKVFVLDEADEMLSMGFAKELNAIINLLPKKRQGLLFSATLEDNIKRIADRHMDNPEYLTLSSDQIGATTIDHFTYFVSGAGRVQDLISVLEIENPESAIVFCNTKAQTETVAKTLTRSGYSADWINGDLPQKDRERVMERTRSGKLRFLVATDVAARGIDVSHVTHVINFELPSQVEQYIHRTGRTGRAGRTGTAISLVGPQELGSLYYLRLSYKIFPVERSLPNKGEERTRKEMDRIAMMEARLRETPDELHLAVARRLVTHPDAERLVAALAQHFFGELQVAEPGDIDETAKAERRAKNPPPVAPKKRARATRATSASSPSTDAPRSAAPRSAAPRSATPSSSARTSEQPRTSDRPRPDSAPAAAVEKPASTSANDSVSVAAPEGTRDDASSEAPRRRRRRTVEERRDAANTRVSNRAEAPDASAPSDAPQGSLEVSGEAPAEDLEPMTRLYVGVGRKDGARAGDLAQLFREHAELERADIGRIRVRDKHAFVYLRSEITESVLERMKDARWSDEPIVIEEARSAK